MILKTLIARDICHPVGIFLPSFGLLYDFFGPFEPTNRTLKTIIPKNF